MKGTKARHQIISRHEADVPPGPESNKVTQVMLLQYQHLPSLIQYYHKKLYYYYYYYCSIPLQEDRKNALGTQNTNTFVIMLIILFEDQLIFFPII